LRTYFKQYLEVVKKEVSLFKTTPLLAGAVLVILLIPTIYTVIYIGALWDPYGKLENLPVGLVNLDKGTTFRGADTHLGNEIVQELKEKKTFNYAEFKNRDQAKEAVRSGEVYFALIIPPDFSQKALPGKEPGKLDLLTSDGTSFVAGLFAKRFAETVAEQLNQKLSLKRWEVVLTSADLGQEAIKELKEGSEEALTGGRKINQGLVTAAEGTYKISENQKKVANALSNIDSEQLVLAGSILHGNTAKLATGLSKPGIMGVFAGLPPSKDLKKLAAGAQTYQNKIEQLADGLKELTTGTTLLAEKQEELADGLTELKEGSESLVAGLENLNQGLKTFHEALPTEKQDPEGFVVSVKAEEKEIIPVPLNGPAFAPYFMALSIWLGVVITTFLFHIIVYPKSVIEKNLMAKILGKGTLTVLISCTAALTLGVVVHLVMKVSLVHPFGYYMTLFISAFAFGTIILSLIRIIGDAGKLISVLFLILQIASAGGAYPIELSASFYQSISPFLPLTYTLEALRASMFGSYGGQWLQSLCYLIPWIVASLGLSLLSRKRFRYVEDSEYGPALDLSFGRK